MPDPSPAPKRTGRAVRIALAVSLSLNLLILGAVGGLWLNRPGPGEAPAIRMLGLGPFAIALSREGRSDMRARIEADLPALARDRVVLGQGLREVQRALLAQPFDRDAAAAALARSRRAALALQGRGHSALLDTFEAMSQEDRAQVANRLGRILHRTTGSRPDG